MRLLSSQIPQPATLRAGKYGPRVLPCLLADTDATDTNVPGRASLPRRQIPLSRIDAGRVIAAIVEDRRWTDFVTGSYLESQDRKIA